MSLDESGLKDVWTGATRTGCLSAETLGLAARGELGILERAAVADHLSGCSDCAEELRLIEPLSAFAERSAVALGRPAATVDPVRGWAVPAWQYAMAAALLLAIGTAGALAMWNVALQRENRELTGRVAVAPRGTDVPVSPSTAPPVQPAVAPDGRSSPAAPPPAGVPRDVAALTEPQVNVPIVDLQPDALRGAADSQRAVARVSADAALVTLILNSDIRQSSGVYALDVIDAQGRSIWRSETLEKTSYNTFTIALSPRGLGAGIYRLELSRLTGTRRTSLESYGLRIEPARSPGRGR